jgi:hypothetical protein
VANSFTPIENTYSTCGMVNTSDILTRRISLIRLYFIMGSLFFIVGWIAFALLFLCTMIKIPVVVPLLAVLLLVVSMSCCYGFVLWTFNLSIPCVILITDKLFPSMPDDLLGIILGLVAFFNVCGLGFFVYLIY